MSDDMRYRFREKPKQTNTSRRESNKSTDSGSIFGIWEEQRRMQAEEDKIAKELAETKRKAKELQKTLRKQRYGDTSVVFKTKTTKYKSDVKQASKKYTTKAKSYSTRVVNWIVSHKKLSVATALFLIVTIGGYSIFINKSSSDSTATLGDKTSSAIPVSDELPREVPKFKLLYPSGKSIDDYDVVRISPDGTDASYTFLDRFTSDGKIFQVTQQEIPDKFDLTKTATEFQATDIIQIDGNKVYSGFSEKGGVQSLIFVKESILVSIRSPQKFSDDQWVAYISSLGL